MKESRLTLHQALMYLQAHYIAIRLTPRSIALWSPNTRVSSSVRNILREYKAEVRQMVLDCKIEVCCSPLWHKQEWHYPLEEWIAGSAVCGICQRLSIIDEVTSNKSNFDKIKVTRVKHSTVQVKESFT